MQKEKSGSTNSIPGPVSGTRLTEDYVRRVGAMAYLWGWPMVNIHNRKTTFEKLPGPRMMGGIVPGRSCEPDRDVARLHCSRGARGRVS